MMQNADNEWKNLLLINNINPPNLKSSISLKNSAGPEYNLSPSIPQTVTHSQTINHPTPKPTSSTLNSSSQTLQPVSVTNNSSNCGDWKSNVLERLKSLESKTENLESKMDSILDLLKSSHLSLHNNSSNGVETICFGKQVIGGRVCLDTDIQCTEVAWRTMNTCSNAPDWCVALLRGTFGEEKAMLYRMNPRFSDLQPFSASFLGVAKTYFREFVERCIRELSCHVEKQPQNDLAALQLNFFKKNIETLVRQIGASLSGRANSMYRQWRKRQVAAGAPLPSRTRRPAISTNRNAGKTCTGRKLLTVPKSLVPRPKGETILSDCESPESQLPLPDL